MKPSDEIEWQVFVSGEDRSGRRMQRAHNSRQKYVCFEYIFTETVISYLLNRRILRVQGEDAQRDEKPSQTGLASFITACDLLSFSSYL